MSKSKTKKTKGAGTRKCNGCNDTIDEQGRSLRFSEKWGMCVRCVAWARHHAIRSTEDPHHMALYTSRVNRAALRQESAAIGALDDWLEVIETNKNEKKKARG